MNVNQIHFQHSEKVVQIYDLPVTGNETQVTFKTDLNGLILQSNTNSDQQNNLKNRNRHSKFSKIYQTWKN